MPETTLPQQAARQRNWAPWLGLLFALAAVLSNAWFFLGLPGQSAIAWLSAVLIVVSARYAGFGVINAFREPQTHGGKVSSLILGVVSLLICGLVAFGSFHARDLPSSAAAPQVGQKVPDFTLADSNGMQLSLGQLLDKEHVSLVAPPDVVAKLRMANQSSSASASPATPIKAVLLIFYRGYW